MNKTQALLVRVLDLFAQRFDKQAVLRGGMVLRVLGCERLTNDLDYVFVPFGSKKDVVSDILDALKDIEGANVRHSLNSKCFRIVLTVDGVSVQIEVKVAMEVPTQTVSTKLLAYEFGYPVRLIPVVDYGVALANKMAAWNERRLHRDVYDIWFYLRMGVKPDSATLKKRLQKPSYSKLVAKKDRLTRLEVDAFYSFLRQKVEGLTDEDIAASLSDYLKPEELSGLSMMFRAEMAKLR